LTRGAVVGSSSGKVTNDAVLRDGETVWWWKTVSQGGPQGAKLSQKGEQ